MVVAVVTVVPAHDVELASDVLWQAGASAVGERDRGDGTVEVTGDLDSAPSGTRWDWQVVEVHDDGLDRWREHARAHRAAPASRIVLRPTWIEGDAGEPARPGDIEVAIDPGRSFGSGSHPTTRMLLARLDALAAQGAFHPPHAPRVLDVGCGSGVLAIGAVLLGARDAVGIDLDPEAVRATSANAERNQVAAAVQASTTPVAAVPGPGGAPGGFDLVLANLSAATIVALGSDLRRLVRPAGRLLLSGILADQADAVVAEFAGWGVAWTQEDDRWVALELSPPAT